MVRLFGRTRKHAYRYYCDIIVVVVIIFPKDRHRNKVWVQVTRARPRMNGGGCGAYVLVRMCNNIITYVQRQECRPPVAAGSPPGPHAFSATQYHRILYPGNRYIPNTWYIRVLYYLGILQKCNTRRIHIIICNMYSQVFINSVVASRCLRVISPR